MTTEFPRSWRVNRHNLFGARIEPPDARPWYVIRNALGALSEPAEVMVYDSIGYGGVTAADFAADLENITASQINLRINSPGGEVFDGIAIYEALRRHRAQVTTYVDSLAASIASVIAMAGDRRVIARNATMMIHDASGLCIGPAADMRELAGLLDRCSDNIADVYAQRAQSGTVASWRKAMKAETWYSADEAVTAGLATEKADPDAEWAGMAAGLTAPTPAQAEWDRITANLRSLPPLRT